MRAWRTASAWCWAATILAILLSALSVRPSAAADIPLIDAHSQVDEQVSLEQVLSVLDQAGISRVILSSLHGRQKTREIIAAARAHPDRITPSIGLKSQQFRGDPAEAIEWLHRAAASPAFHAMSEFMLLHQQKGNRAPEIRVAFDAPQLREALAIAAKRHWPFVIHMEFGFATAFGRYDDYMTGLEQLLSSHPDQPIALTHMGQLAAAEVGRLIAAHRNIYFLTSHANPVFINDRGSGLPWANLFAGDALASRWRDLILRHPDRFILAFDNVYDEDWSDHYVRQVQLWRAALETLPRDAAEAVAHRNAERLWHLPPAKPVPSSTAPAGNSAGAPHQGFHTERRRRR